ncbi:hypothetical protein PUN28_011753 [Cardiocondyla obscurior]|uniref:Uncharacterized protein n=1 Tax=Cardiocondyla obscurior TaxID=286306 RepID=A0AAW2FHZ6_9HYME
MYANVENKNSKNCFKGFKFNYVCCKSRDLPCYVICLSEKIKSEIFYTSLLHYDHVTFFI